MTQHSTQTTSVLSSTSRRGRLPKRSWPVRLVLVAALLLAVPFLFDSGSTVHAADNDVTGLTLTSLNPGELAITWDAPSRAPTDYRVTWKKSDGKWPSYKNDNTVEGGNAFPTGTSHTVSDLEEGIEYSVRVRARYHNSEGNVEESGPWSDPPAEITVSSTPSKDGEGDSNEGRSTSVPAKPTGISYGASHNNVLMFWTDPDDDSITGYQVLRGDAAANLAVLTDDTGSASASYSDDTVEPETTYAYAIRARNAAGLGPQSDTVSVTTGLAPVEPEIALAIAGVEFIIAGQTLDTTSTCSEDDITQIADDCTENITNPTPQFGVVGTLDGNDRVQVNIGRNLAGVTQVADQSDLQGANARITPTFQPGRNLLTIWGDEDGDSGGAEQHFFRINVVPYWEWNGNTLSKDSDCRDTIANAPAVGEITDADCIVTQFGNTAELRFFNVINEHFNVYVEVNGTNVISEPSTTDLGSSFTVNLDAGDNLIRIRLAAKGGQPTGEVYDSDSFYYKVTTTDFLVSNLGHTGIVARVNARLLIATQFTTGGNPNGYTVSKVRLPISVSAASVTPVVAIYSDVSGSPGASIKTLANPASITVSTTTAPEAEFDADDYKLNASTPYWIVVENPHALERLRTSLTTEDSEDAGGAPGWSIGNVSKTRGTGEAFADTSNSLVMQIGIKGALAAASTDATLSNLEVIPSPLTGTAAALNPTFSPEITDYTLTVENEHTRAEIYAASNDENSTIEFLDKDDTTIPPGGTDVGAAWIVPNLDVGENIFKIKVTAEDTTTTKTYQVTITRDEQFLVSNLGQTTRAGGTNLTNPMATQFTTGSNANGYTISSVAFSISVPSGATPEVSIYSDSSGEPGSSLKELSNPSNFSTTTRMEAEFGADNYRLQRNTSYWIVIDDSAFTDNILLDDTESDSEDAGGAPGWSIGNVSKVRVPGAWEDLTLSRVIQIAVKGAVAETPAAPASLTASPGNAEATLTWTAPASDGGHAITKYQYRVSDDGGTTWSPDWTDVPDADSDSDLADERSVTVTSLANGTLHTFQVRAVNSEGGGSEAEDTATPVAFLVSNANSIVNQGTLGTTEDGVASNKRAIQFTTGGNPSGYKIDTVQLTILTSNGMTPRFSIYSDSSGVPGSSLKILTNPGTLPTSYALADFDAGQYPLKPNTSNGSSLKRHPQRAGGSTVLPNPRQRTPVPPQAGASATTSINLSREHGPIYQASDTSPR